VRIIKELKNNIDGCVVHTRIVEDDVTKESGHVVVISSVAPIGSTLCTHEDADSWPNDMDERLVQAYMDAMHSDSLRFARNYRLCKDR